MARRSIIPTLDWVPDEYQKQYLRTLRTTPVTFVDAPSGTGKTTLALYVAFQHLLSESNINRIVYLRFPDDRYLKQGFLPGTLEEKSAGLFEPFYDAIEELSVPEPILDQFRRDEQLTLTTDAVLRGTNLKHTFLVMDETQNARTVDDLHLVLTRLHDTSKAAILGHSKQQDNRRTERYTKDELTPFQLFTRHMTKQPWAVSVPLLNNYRGEISRWADQIWEVL